MRGAQFRARLRAASRRLRRSRLLTVRSRCAGFLVACTALAILALPAPQLAQQTSTPAQTQPTTPPTPPPPPPKKTTRKSIDPNATAGVRGLGLPVLVQVRRHGKPVAHAPVSVKTDAGVEIAHGETDTSGNWSLKLDAGDYTLSATSGDTEHHLDAHIVATSSTSPTKLTIPM